MIAKIPALVEGQLEAVVLPAIFRQLDLSQLDLQIRVAGGGTRFWIDAQRYNNAARVQPIVALADLEQADCAGAVLSREFPTGRQQDFALRLARRMLESWLLADRDAMASFLGVSVRLIPRDPDEESHPKRRLVEIARRSTKRSIRDALIPTDTGSPVGAEYLPTMSAYVRDNWRVAEASEVSPSLCRACRSWTRLAARITR